MSSGEHAEQSAILALCQSSDRGPDNTTSTTCVTPWLGLCRRERVSTSEIPFEREKSAVANPASVKKQFFRGNMVL